MLECAIEALMRIVDANGTVYVLADFMEIAKKYHIYARLSKMMIRRVLPETDDKPIAVSINLSAYDINSGNLELQHSLERYGVDFSQEHCMSGP